MRGGGHNVSRKDAKTQSEAKRGFAVFGLTFFPGVMGGAARIAALCLLVVSLLSMPALAGPEGDFAVANRAYADGDFAAALRGYERALADGFHANALYNLGNTCFRLGKLGPAALSYERALALRPRQPDAAANLKLTREKSGARLLEEPWWERALLWLPPGSATATALGGCWFFFLLGASIAWRRRGGAGVWGCGLGVLLMAGYAAAIFWEQARREQVAIVIADRTAARPEPAERAPVSEALPPGSQVRVIGGHAGWAYCRLPGGQRGWVPSASLDFILPRQKAAENSQEGSPIPRLVSLAAAAALPAVPVSTDWRNELSKQPGSFAALRPATFHYAFGWSGLTAAEADAEFTLSPDGQYVLDFSAKTTGIVRTMWKMDAVAASACHPTTFRPARLTQTETYKDKKVTTVVDFLTDGPTRLRRIDPPDRGAATLAKFNFSDVHDLNSAVLFIRSQRLDQGDSVKLCVFPASAPYLTTVTVTGRGKIKVAGREWDAIKCDLQLSRIENDFTLTPHKKFKKATAWISEDHDRLLLKIEAEVFVGRIWAELRRVGFPEKKLAR